MRTSRATRFDVIILGSGIGGSMLAAILARHGVSVLLLEELVHPRFTIGESLIPETGVRLRILAEKHGVPELGWLGAFHALKENVSGACGVKRAFSFMYHREGERARADEVTQLPTLTPPFGPDSHLYRQDTDAWLAQIAVRYGATFRQQVKVGAVRLGDDGVEVETPTGALSARFLIDAGGMRSHVSTLLGLRDAVPRFRTDTRALYNHVLGMAPAERLLHGQDPGVPSPLGQGTMHHIFDGGWMWIIPFGNHRDATNPLTSIGLMLDRRRHPQPAGTPEEELAALGARFPSIGEHLEGVTPVRPWVASGRIQYSQRRHVGDRMIQLPHAACFVDPLYSSGMSVLTVAVDLIAEALLPALKDERFTAERFARIEEVVNAGFDHYDDIVSTSFDAFASFELWSAWNRCWALGNVLGTFGPLARLVDYLGTGDRAALDRTTAPGSVGVLSSHLPEIQGAFAAGREDIQRALAGALSHEAAAARIFDRLGDLECAPPHMGFNRREQRAPGTFTLQEGIRHVLWYRHRAAPRWRAWCDFSLLTYAAQVARFSAASALDGLRQVGAALRDVVRAGNAEASLPPKALSAHAQAWTAEHQAAGAAGEGVWVG